MGLGTGVAQWLRDQGHDAVHLREASMSRATDQEVFAKAQRESRVVVTCDLDFGEILAMSGAIVSVVVMRLANPATMRAIERLDVVLANCAAELDRGAIVAVEESRLRVRSLPIGS